jgi:hypothetical protein
MPSLAVDLVTLGVFFVGFVFGYYFRAWRERVDGLTELRELGAEKKLREWLRSTDKERTP